MLLGRVVADTLPKLPDVGGGDRRAASGTNFFGHFFERELAPLRRVDGSKEEVELLGQRRQMRRFSLRVRRTPWLGSHVRAPGRPAASRSYPSIPRKSTDV